MKTFRFIIILILSTSAAFAQQDSTQIQANRKLQKELNISELKATKMQNALQLNRVALDRLLKNTDLAAAERQKQVNLLVDEKEEAIRSILSVEEYKKFQDLIAARMQAHRNKTAASSEQSRQQKQPNPRSVGEKRP